jgi:PST family polysaccharide transporter
MASHEKITRLSVVVWSGLENSCRQILSLVFFFVSVRFLHPYDLGIFAIAAAYQSVTLIFINDMIGETLVQKSVVTDADWNTGFTINLILAGGFLLVSLVTSHPLALLLKEPSLTFVVPALCFATLISAFGEIQKAFLGRALRFKFIAQTSLIGQVVGGSTSVLLAVFGYGYWALIANVVVTYSLTSAIYWRYSSWKPHIQIDFTIVRTKLSYAVYFALIRSVYTIRDQSPLIIIGLFADVVQVGLFSFALRICRSLSLIFEEVTTRPLISIISREHEVNRFVSVLNDIITMIGVSALPMFVGLAMLGPSLIPLIFGSKWAIAGGLLPDLCIVLGSWLMLHIVIVSLRSKNLGRTAVALSSVVTFIDALIVALLAPFSIEVALTGWAARSILSIPVSIWILHSRLGLSVKTLLSRWIPPLSATVAMAGMLSLFDDKTRESVKGLIGIVGSSGLIYLVILLISTMIIIGPNPVFQKLKAAVSR